MSSDKQRAAAIAELMSQVAADPSIKVEDLRKMVSALSSHRGTLDWWFQNENPNQPKHCLSPMTLHNMKLKLEAGTLVPNMLKFENLLRTAIYYQQIAVRKRTRA